MIREHYLSDKKLCSRKTETRKVRLFLPGRERSRFALQGGERSVGNAVLGTKKMAFGGEREEERLGNMRSQPGIEK